MIVLQKLLTPALSARVREEGLSDVGGPVVDAADAAPLRTPDALIKAYGLGAEHMGEDPQWVDVVRFPLLPTMRVGKASTPDAPWPAFATGFLHATDLTPVWLLQRTRYPRGAELWRLHADGREEVLTAYHGAARGWVGAHQWAPPTHLTGTRVTWSGVELPADLVDPAGDVLELVVLSEDVPQGFEQVRPRVSVRGAHRAECEQVFERVVTCTWKGNPARVIRSGGGTARLLLDTCLPDVARTVDAQEVEPGVYEVDAPVDQLADMGGHVDELKPPTP
ncbi:hypothetical protein [Cellulomonas bogoriensis]|uniref:Uncharacterized protein n=1 Tax=Cellulomonas bogoriensis 69B4 = DSM 16987 TaxID=1386082 RepID=A0A0A0C2B5_9CELL|nr:hypothetical protein [Cellulomonas bogoriensis]KGM13534.1 hypothetical protein N869_13280 [Cellulomonas bogoriensis 69B4 = DSM 16987]